MASREDRSWWDMPPAEAADTIVSLAETLRQQQSGRRANNLHCLTLYHGKRVNSVLPGSFGRAGLDDFVNRRERLSINVVRNITNALTSHLAKNKIRTVYQTNGGDWAQRYTAQLRTQFVDRLLRRENVYATGLRVAQDACIMGTGLARVFAERGRVRIEHTFPGEVYIDDAESVYGEPRQLFHVRSMDRLEAKALWPEHAKAIEDAASPSHQYHGRGAVADRIVVYEAYHLPSEPGASDGRHAIAFDGACPVFREWRHASFPYAKFNYSDPPLGWWGSGVADELTGIQYEINSICRSVQEQMYRGGGLKILAERGSKITTSQLGNGHATVIHYTGQPPTWIAPTTVNPQALAHLQWLIDQAYAITGISQLAARSELPAGLRSGRAQLVYKSFQSRRLLATEERYNQFFVDLAERALEVAADIVAEGGEVRIPATPGDDFEYIDFEEIALDGDDYEVQPAQESNLPEEPAGRLEMVEQYRAAGYIDMPTAKRLLELPHDLRAETRLDLSPEELIDKRIYTMMRPNGRYLPPHPYMDLELALTRSTLAVQFAELQGVPDELIDNVRMFHDAVVDLIEQGQEQAPQALPGPEALPPGGAMPPQGLPEAGPVPGL